jgi:hypothetical protein
LFINVSRAYPVLSSFIKRALAETHFVVLVLVVLLVLDSRSGVDFADRCREVFVP